MSETTATSSTTVSVKAPWLLTEILPILIFAGLAVASLVAGFTGGTPWTAALVGAGLALILVLVIFLVSKKRKKNSTLFATYSTEGDRLLNVWMVKPMQDKWNGRLDEGRNKSPLGLASRVEYKVYGGTPVFQFTSSSGKTVAVPQRLLEHPDVFQFVKETVEELPPLRFRNTDSAEQFAGYISTGRFNPVDVAPVAIVHPNAQAEAALMGRPVKKGTAEKKAEKSPADDDRLQVIVEENEVATPAVAEDEVPKKPLVAVDYAALRVTPAAQVADEEGTTLLVSGLTTSLDAPREEELEVSDDDKDNGWSAGSLLLGGGFATETVDSDSSRNQK